MREYNYKNWNDQPSSKPLEYSVSDKLGGWLGIDKAAKKVGHKVANLLRPEKKTQVEEEEVKKYTEEKI